VNRDLISVLVSSGAAVFNPSLLAAVTVMLLLPHPKRLMLGYLFGTYATSMIFGLVFVFSWHGSSATSTSRHTLSPAEDIVAGLVAIGVAVVLAKRLDAPLRSRREQRKQAKTKPGEDKEGWQLRLLGRGSMRVTFAVGAALSFPGVSYLSALGHIVKLHPGTVTKVLLVVYFCLMQQLLLEFPLLGYVFAPGRTQDAVAGFRAWLDRRGRRIVTISATAIGTVLLSRGLITLA
jgi:Sap, sulfolipid-1-addressing protein